MSQICHICGPDNHECPTVMCAPCLLAEFSKFIEERDTSNSVQADMEYWNAGTEIIEKCLADAIRAYTNDVPIPLVGEQAKLWHMASASAYQHALEMMGKPR